MSGWRAGTVVLIGFLVTGFFDASAGAVIVLSGFAYISRCLRDAFSAPPVPTELHVTNRMDATALALED